MRKLLISLTAVAALMFTGAAYAQTTPAVGPYECLTGGTLEALTGTSLTNSENCPFVVEGQGDCSGFQLGQRSNLLPICALTLQGKLHFDNPDNDTYTGNGVRAGCDIWGNCGFLHVHGQLDMTISAGSFTSTTNYFCSGYVHGGCKVDGDADHAKCWIEYEPGFHDLFEPYICSGAFQIEAQRFNDTLFTFIITNINQIHPLGVINGLSNGLGSPQFGLGSTNLKGLGNLFEEYGR